MSARVPFSSRPFSVLLRRSLQHRINNATVASTRSIGDRSKEQINSQLPATTPAATLPPTSTTVAPSSSAASSPCTTASTTRSSVVLSASSASSSPSSASAASHVNRRLSHQRQQQRQHRQQRYDQQPQLQTTAAPSVSASTTAWQQHYDAVWEDGTGNEPLDAAHTQHIDYYYLSDNSAITGAPTSSSSLPSTSPPEIAAEMDVLNMDQSGDTVSSDAFPAEWFLRKTKIEEHISQEDEEDGHGHQYNHHQQHQQQVTRPHPRSVI